MFIRPFSLQTIPRRAEPVLSHRTIHTSGDKSEASNEGASLFAGFVAAGDLHFPFLRHLCDELGAPIQERFWGKTTQVLQARHSGLDGLQ